MCYKEENTLDKAHSNVKQGYRSTPLPHLCQSDYLSVLWSEGACFERANWDVFKNQDLEVYTSTVLCYIKD